MLEQLRDYRTTQQGSKHPFPHSLHFKKYTYTHSEDRTLTPIGLLVCENAFEKEIDVWNHIAAFLAGPAKSALLYEGEVSTGGFEGY